MKVVESVSPRGPSFGCIDMDHSEINKERGHHIHGLYHRLDSFHFMRELIPRLGFPVTLLGLGVSSKGIYRYYDFGLVVIILILALIGCLKKEGKGHRWKSVIEWAQGFNFMYLGFGITLAMTSNKFNEISPWASFLFLLVGIMFIGGGFYELGKFIGKQVYYLHTENPLWAIVIGIISVLAGGLLTWVKWDWIAEKPSYNALLPIILISMGILLIYACWKRSSLRRLKMLDDRENEISQVKEPSDTEEVIHGIIEHENNAKNEQVLLSDQALTSADQDKLERKDFAELLARVLLEYKNPSSLVLAIYGPWGVGKSSFMNFMAEYLGKLAQEDHTPIMVNFNPWNYSSIDQLTTMFFEELRLTLGQKDKSEKAENIGKALKILGYVLSPGSLSPIGAQYFEKSSELLRSSGEKIIEVHVNINHWIK